MFEVGETIIISTEIRTSAGVLTTPATSTKITILDPFSNVVANAATMTEDSTGQFHYDYTIAADKGTYTWTITATDGTRITKQKGEFSAV